ncbi:MAG: TetR/AcrR family transcriptional regulator [Alphaproteobacteria bacterium]|nr:TetR/AcrR family transcriptional regulator [Alphaproteobacteria bacterium]
MTRSPASGDRSLVTRTLLLETAERLFAESGIDSVSMRQIAATAGQRNNYATQYHFGTKEDLIRALFELRLQPIEARRAALLADIETRQETGNVRLLIEAAFRPAAETLLSADGPCHYLRFLARATVQFPLSYFERGSGAAPAYARIVEHLNACLPGLTPRARRQRIGWSALIANQVLAQLEGALAGLPLDERKAKLDPAFANLCDFCTGGLLGPPRP